MFQAKIEISELAYLLHTLNAQQIIGADNTQLFPLDPNETKALLEKGLATLKANGRLVPDGNAFKMHPLLMLSATIIVEPQRAIALTRRVGELGRQYITYYGGRTLTLEQFFTADDHYLITQLPNPAEVANRLSQALALPEQAIWPQPITLNLSQLEQLKQGQELDWFQLLSAESEDPNQLQDALLGLEAVGALDLVARQPDGRYIATQVMVVKAKQGAAWVILNSDQENVFVLQPLDSQRFAEFIQPHLMLPKAVAE